MNLVKTKRVKLKGKSAKEFYNAIYERDGGMCVQCGAPIEYGVKHHHEPCGIYKSDEKEKAVMLCPACHHRRHFQDAAEGETVCREYLQSLDAHPPRHWKNRNNMAPKQGNGLSWRLLHKAGSKFEITDY